MTTVRKAVVVGGNRIPFARANGAYATASNQDMLTAALDGLVARFGLQGERIGEVAAGAVLKHSRAFNLTREAVLGKTNYDHFPQELADTFNENDKKAFAGQTIHHEVS